MVVDTISTVLEGSLMRIVFCDSYAMKLKINNNKQKSFSKHKVSSTARLIKELLRLVGSARSFRFELCELLSRWLER